MAFDAASLAAKAASMREAGVIVSRPRSNFKVTTKHIGKRTNISADEEHNRDWWIEYEAQNR